MKALVKVSIGIPTYNSELYILDALDSVINQSYSNWNLWIADNNSQDNTHKIISEWINNNKSFENKIHYSRHHSNIGMINNWNYLLSLFNGKYGKILCSDDRLQSNCLKEQVHILENNPNIALTSSYWNIISKSGKLLFLKKPYRNSKIIEGSKIILESYLRISNPIGQPSAVMMRRSNTNQSFFTFNSQFKYYCDIECWLQYLDIGDFYLYPGALYDFRVHHKSETANINSLSDERAQFTLALQQKYPFLSQVKMSFFIKLRLLLRDIARSTVYQITRYFL